MGYWEFAVPIARKPYDAMPMFQADRCRELAAECRRLALLSEDELEKTLLTNLALSWNRIANQTDRYAQLLTARQRKAPSVGGLPVR